MLMRTINKAIAFVLLTLPLVYPTSGWCAQNDERLDTLFVRLHEASDRVEARNIEGLIWQIWLESGDEELDKRMRQGIFAMNSRDFEIALMAFDAIINIAPEYAEGWNKRATLYWLMGELEKSIEDIERTLELEPRHFGALSGLGMIRKAQKRPADAIEAYRQALDIYPTMPNAAAQIRLLGDQLGESI